MNMNGMSKEVRRYLEKAERALAAAEVLLRDGYPSDAAGRAYYAMFYAAQAALRSEGIEVIKHSAVESFFGRHFVKAGRMDPTFHKMLIHARQTLEDGKAFVNAVKVVLAT